MSRKAFTLIELLVVVAIIGILAEQKKAFNYKNCTPKWAKENLSKGARYVG